MKIIDNYDAETQALFVKFLKILNVAGPDVAATFIINLTARLMACERNTDLTEVLGKDAIQAAGDRLLDVYEVLDAHYGAAGTADN